MAAHKAQESRCMIVEMLRTVLDVWVRNLRVRWEVKSNVNRGSGK